MEDSFSFTVESLLEAFSVDRGLKRGEETEHFRRQFRGYGGGHVHISHPEEYKGKMRGKMPSNTCIVCGRKGCHS